MIKLEIVNKDKYEYSLKDEKQQNYSINLEFLDINEKPEVGDYICMSSELLNSKFAGYSTNYAFGNLENKCGKENISLNDIDVICIMKNGKKIYLKRLYG